MLSVWVSIVETNSWPVSCRCVRGAFQPSFGSETRGMVVVCSHPIRRLSHLPSQLLHFPHTNHYGRDDDDKQ